MDVLPETTYQRCIINDVTHMLKVIQAQESLYAARGKSRAIVQDIRDMWLNEAANHEIRRRPLVVETVLDGE